MDMCDIIITKPGGLTTAESMAKGIPMILTLPIPGQEERNRDLFIKGNMALAGDTPREAAVALKRFIMEQELLQEYKRNMSLKAKPCSSLDIAKEIIESASEGS
jgi:processive 1,2-diacylglycerol beta-glucosyltransferase